MTYIPRWFGSAGARLGKRPEEPGGWSARVFTNAQGQMWQKSDLGKWFKTKPFEVWSVDARYRLDRAITFYGSVENLFNRRYEYIFDVPMPGTTAVAGVEVAF